MNEKIKLYLNTVFHVAWILIALLIWILFLLVFLDNAGFGFWIAWGFACTLVMIPSAAKFIWECTREGYREGSHSYTGNLFSTAYGRIGISIRDRRYSQAILTMVMSVIVFLMIGPVLLPIKVVISALELVPLIRELCTDKVFSIKALKITGIVILVLVTILICISIFKACTTLNENYEIFGEEVTDGYQLEVRRLNGKDVLDRDKYTWSVSDDKVAYVSSSDVLIFKKGGYVVVRATSTENTKDYIEKDFFVPYDIVKYSGDAVVSELNDSNAEEFFLSLAKVVAADTYNIVCATRADKLLDVIDELSDMFVTFSDDDAYLFSSALGKYHVENEVLYELSDWTCNDVDVSQCSITREQLSEIVCKPYNSQYQDGESIIDYGVNSINPLIDREIPADGVYRFSQMDDRYEYRVVVRGNFDYGISSHYYRHGLLTGFVGAIKDIAKWDWNALSEEWMEIRDYNEISNLSNLRICIEYREK